MTEHFVQLIFLYFCVYSYITSHNVLLIEPIKLYNVCSYNVII